MDDFHENERTLAGALGANTRLRLHADGRDLVNVRPLGRNGLPEAVVLVDDDGGQMIWGHAFGRPAGDFVATFVRTRHVDLPLAGDAIIGWLANELENYRFLPLHAARPHDTFSDTVSFSGAVADLAAMIIRLDPERACPPGALEAGLAADWRTISLYAGHAH